MRHADQQSYQNTRYSQKNQPNPPHHSSHPSPKSFLGRYVSKRLSNVRSSVHVQVSRWRLRSLSIAVALGLGSVSVQGQAANVNDINALVSQAITTHPLVGAARAEKQATAEGVTAAKLNLFPQPSISSSYDRNDGMISRLGVRQPLWSGGKLTANVNQAIYDDKAAMAYILEQQNTVAKNTIDVWQNYVYAVVLQDLYANDLQQLNEFEAMMQRRVQQGVSARIDLDLVTNRILQDQNAYQGAVQQQRIAAARLSQMIGEPVNDSQGQQVPLNQMAKYVKSQSKDFEKLAFSQISFNNPSVIKQQFQVEAAKQEVKAQQAAQYPTVYAQYEHLYYHKDHNDDGQFSLGLSYDPGAGFSNMALARASQARVQSLAQTQEAARRTVMEDIQTQYQQFVSAKDQETSLIAAVAGSQIVVDSYRRQFIAGRKSWLEVLNAVREKTGYQQQLLQVQSQMLAAFYKLQVDFGRMPWQSSNLLYQPVDEYHPYLEFKDWLKTQGEYLQTQLPQRTQVQSVEAPETIITTETIAITETAAPETKTETTETKTTETKTTETKITEKPNLSEGTQTLQASELPDLTTATLAKTDNLSNEGYRHEALPLPTIPPSPNPTAASTQTLIVSESRRVAVMPQTATTADNNPMSNDNNN